MGFTASPLMGRVLSDLVLGRDPGRDLTSFAPDRF
jgi:glycine/D-amino acid oxidase-like deaminating enzyme